MRDVVKRTKLTENCSKKTIKKYVDEVIQELTLDEKIGQLLMIPVYSDKNEKYYSDIDYLISRHQIGGIIFFQGRPSRQATSFCGSARTSSISAESSSSRRAPRSWAIRSASR